MSNTKQSFAQPLRFGEIDIPVAEQTPLVLLLLSVIQQLKKENQELRDEIQRLKGTTRRPDSVTAHFGLGLRQYMLLQAHQNHVTQNRFVWQVAD